MPRKDSTEPVPTFKASEQVALKNINPMGAVDLPGLGLRLDAGEVFEVDGKTANELLKQATNYEISSKPAPKTED